MNCTKSRRDIAYELKLKHRGPEVYFRGLIEISNICRKNCQVISDVIAGQIFCVR